MQFRPDLFERLINHRVSDQIARREDFLTEVFAWMMQNDVGLRAKVLAAQGPLYRGQGGDHPPSSTDDIEIETQIQSRFEGHGRPDMVFVGRDDWFLVVESKVDASYDHHQVRNYMKWVEKRPNARLVALVPRRQMAGNLGRVQHEGFLGMRAWEDIDKLLDPEGLNATVDSLRAALHTLLQNFNLVDLPETTVSWQAQNDATEVRAVEALCLHLDAAMADVAQGDFDSGVNQVYRPDGGPLPLRKYSGQHPIRSGSGPAPRPVMGHRTVLPVRQGVVGIGELWVELSFRPYSGDRNTSGMRLVLWVGSPAGGNGFKDEPDAMRRLISQATGMEPPAAHLEGRVPGLLRRYRDRMLAVFHRVHHHLSETGRYPQMEKAPQTGDSGPTLHLCDTAELLGEEINTTDAVRKYEAVLTDVLRAFLASDPDQPMMQLLAEASAPQWFPE